MPKELPPNIELTSEEERTKRNYNKDAEKWQGARRAGSSFLNKEISKFKELLPNGCVLEIGSGAGHDASWLIDSGYDYLGTDISSGMLEQARKNNPGVRFDEISVYNLNFDELFDGFWCSAVLLHIPKNRLDTALSAIHRSIKQDAYGFICTKEGDSEVVERDGRFHAYWSDRDFSERLNDNGYKIIERNSLLTNHSTGEIKWLTYIVQKDSRKDSH